MRTLLVGALVLGGCGSAATEAQLRDLKARLDVSEQQRVEMGRRLEELDNRVFLLTDQVESQKVALSQRGGAPRLPVVTLKPQAPAPHDSVLIGPPAAEVLPEADVGPPPVEDKRPTVSLSLTGDATPWLGPDRDAAEVKASHSDGAKRAGPAAPPSVRVAPSASMAGRRAPKAVSPPVEAGLGVTHGKPPLVDEVVGGQGSAGPVAPSAPSVKPAAPTSVAALPVAPPMPAPPEPEEDPTALYRAAYGRLKAGQPAAAADDLRAFVRRFPQHDLADNAQYWLGESYYTRGDYKGAEPEFRAVVRRWPSGNKVPDALLKLGYCLISQGDRVQGRATLEQLAEHYPRTEAATLAQRRLDELGTEGKR